MVIGVTNATMLPVIIIFSTGFGGRLMVLTAYAKLKQESDILQQYLTIFRLIRFFFIKHGSVSQTGRGYPRCYCRTGFPRVAE
jgi:hypothetical protein